MVRAYIYGYKSLSEDERILVVLNKHMTLSSLCKKYIMPSQVLRVNQKYTYAIYNATIQKYTYAIYNATIHYIIFLIIQIS